MRLLLLAAIALLAWYGWKRFKRWQETLNRQARERLAEEERAAATARKVEGEDLVKCPHCGAYAAPGHALTCSQANNPPAA